MTSELAGHGSSTWRWLRWVLLAIVIVGGFAACFFMGAIHPHKNILRFEPHYPERNPKPIRTVSITGAIPQNLQIKFLARYAATQGNEACNRNMPLGPGFPLHLVEPLDDVRDGANYKISVTVDKYQPGECGWALVFVGYQLLDKDPILDREEGFETGGVPIAYFSQEDKLPATSNWRGRVDLWCYKGPVGHRQMLPETCGVLDGWKSSSFRMSAPPDQSGENASTWVLPGSITAEINFRSLDTVMTAPVDQD